MSGPQSALFGGAVVIAFLAGAAQSDRRGADRIGDAVLVLVAAWFVAFLLHVVGAW